MKIHGAMLKLELSAQLLHFLAPRAEGSGGAYRVGSIRRPSTLSNNFFSKTTEPNVTKFHMQPPGIVGTKMAKMVLIQNSRWPPCPYMIKNRFKRLLLQNHRPIRLIFCRKHKGYLFILKKTLKSFRSDHNRTRMGWVKLRKMTSNFGYMNPLSWKANFS